MDTSKAAQHLQKLSRAVMTQAQVEASRRNGKLGGRPKGKAKSVLVRTIQPTRTGLD